MGLYLFREIDLYLKIDLSNRRHLSIERRGETGENKGLYLCILINNWSIIMDRNKPKK